MIAPVPVFSWTGFYVGVQAGYASGRDSATVFDTLGRPVLLGFRPGISNTVSYDPGGFVGGVHAGFNYQINSVVVGLEGDLEAAGITGDRTLAQTPVPGVFGSNSSKTEIDWQGSIRARIGFAIDRALIYATGGVALADMRDTYSSTLAVFGVSQTLNQSFRDARWGWTVGAGVEYAFTANVTGRVEYRYTQFDDFSNVPFTGLTSIRQDPELHTVRAGVSYKF